MRKIAAPDRSAYERGFIVVAVLWILAALAGLAVIAAMYVSQSAIALTSNDDSGKTDPLIRAGLELTAYQLSSPAAKAQPTRGAFRFRLGSAEIAVEFVSEAARIDLNFAKRGQIAGLFTVLGANAEAAEDYAERVIKWRTTPKSNARDDEESLYRTAGLTYLPRRAPFNHVEELWLVAGLPPALVERAMAFVTIYSGMSEVNVLDAPPEVIAALPDMTPQRLNSFLDQRDSLPPDPAIVIGALGGKQPGATTQGSAAYRVRVLISAPGIRRKFAEVVIMIIQGSLDIPYRVLSWASDVDPVTGLMRNPAERR